MKKSINRIGMTKLEPEEGYLLRQRGSSETYRSVLLGKYDNELFYEEVIDPTYVQPIPDETEELPQYESLYILTSPNGTRFQVTVADDGTLTTKEL